MTLSTWPLYHIVDEQSRRNLLRARGAGDLPELPQGERVRAWDRAPSREVDKLMRTPPVGPERRTA